SMRRPPATPTPFPYTTLFRSVTIGWKAMAKLARMTPRNTRRNCQTLIDKLAVEQLSEENSRESIGRTYRLFSYKAILERRRAARSEEHTSELQSLAYLVCRLL